MAKINNKVTYPLEQYPDLKDFLIGSKELGGKTMNFPLIEVLELFKTSVDINSIQYQFSTGSNPDIDYYTQGAFFTDNNETNPNNFSKIILNKLTVSGDDLTELFNFFAITDDLVLSLSNPSNPNNFFQFKVVNVDNQIDYFVFDVTLLANNYIGELQDSAYYNINWQIYQDLSTKADLSGAVFTGDVEAPKFIVTGGLPNQFLKADGSLDNNSYALTSDLHDPVTLGTANGLSLANQVLSLALASDSQNGALSSTDWYTFNNKISTIEGIVAGGELSGTYPNPTLINSAVINKVLTGFNTLGGTLLPTDTILEAFGKLQNQTNGLVGGVRYIGLWDASTNTPPLANGSGAQGDLYIVSVAGSTSLDGISTWAIGDRLIRNATAWTKPPNSTDAVLSVNGYVGVVNLTSADIVENSATNRWYTPARENVKADKTIIIGTAGPLTGGGDLSVNRTISIPAATTSVDGYLTATDWNTFNNKANASGSANYIQNQNAAAQTANFWISGNGIFKGNVAIGTNTLISNSILTLQENATTATAISFINRNSTQQWAIAIDAAAVDDKYFALIDQTNSQVRLVVGNNGNVGIGTTSPLQKFVVSNNGALGFEVALDPSNNFITLQSYDRIAAAYRRIEYTGSLHLFRTGIASTGTTNNFTEIITPSDGGKGLYHGMDITNRLFYWRKNDSDDYGFDFQKNDGTSFFRISSNGNVGIGTTNPNFSSTGRVVLDINGSSSSLIAQSVGGVAKGYLYTNGTDYSINNEGTGILALANGGLQRLVITNGGNVLIGTTTDSGEKLQVNGKLKLTNGFSATNAAIVYKANTDYLFIGADNGSTIGGAAIVLSGSSNTNVPAGSISLKTSGGGGLDILSDNQATFTSGVTATGFFTTSDIRLKNLIEPTHKTPNQLKAISFVWKDKEKDQTPQIGYSAQEVQKYIPDAVSKDNNGYLSVNYTQVLIAKIETLENQISELRGFITGVTN